MKKTFRRLLVWMAGLFYLQVAVLGVSLTRFHDSGVTIGFFYALGTALLLSWGLRQLDKNRPAIAADALYITILGANVVAMLKSPSHWAGGILPVLASTLILPHFSGAALRRRLLGAFLMTLTGMVVHSILPHPTQTPATFLTWYPVMTQTMAVSLAVYALLLFRRSLEDDLNAREASIVSAAESVLRYSQMAKASLQGIWMLGPDGGDRFVNARLLKMLGRENGLGESQVIDKLEEPGRGMTLALLKGESAAAEAREVRLMRPDGTVVPALMTLNLIKDEASRPAGAIVKLTDIRERAELDERLGQAARLEGVAELAGGLASELNEQLSHVVSASTELEKALPGRASMSDDLAAIDNASERAAGLLRQLLAFSRRQKMEPEILDLAWLIHSMRLTLERACGAGISVSVDAAEGLGLCRADPSQLEQVILNLTINARDAMPRGGRIEMRLDRSRLEDPASPLQGPVLRLRVSDNGQGVRPEDLGRVFEPFFSTKERGRGSGLGLATVYGIVRQSGGVIRMESRLGKGSEIEICLPVVGEAP